MKNWKVLLFLLWGSVSALSQTPTYQYRLMNDLQVSSTVYEFDIYLKRTGATTLEIANTQAGLNFNTAIRNGGTLTFSIVAATSEFLAGQVPTAFSVDTTNSILRIQAKENPGSGNGTIVADTGNGIRFGRFRITDSAPFGSVTPNLSWNFISTGGKFPSRLSAYVSGIATDVTVQDSHKVNLVNPVLNTSISGVKFNDLNGDGIRDAGEPGLASWRIRLSTGGSQVDSMLTDGSGNYGFPNLANGTYTVSEQVQTGWIQTSTPASYTIVVSTGSFSANNNFGNFQLATIDGMKFNDVNGNGVKDVGDAGLSGWRIRLSKNGTQVDSALTDGSGNYTFGSLTAGTYTVSEAVQNGWTQTLPSSPGTYTVIVTSGTASTGNHFGNYQYGTINGQKFNDLNGNGAKDGGEGGLSGWKILLTGPISTSTFTDGSGNYSFGNLIAGSYTVSESLQSGWVQSFPSTPGTHVLSISSGSVYTNKDFGNFQPGSISGMKFHDVNGNGAKDGGESGLSNWRIRLALNGVPFDSALTDGSGNYTFVNLAPGRALVILVGEDGAVENRIIDVPPGLPPAIFVRASNYLSTRFQGKTIAEVQLFMKLEMDTLRRELDEVSAKIVETGIAVWSGESDADSKTLIVRGQANLLENTKAFEELEKIRKLFEDIENKRELVQLLGLAEAGEGVRIFIGSENKLFSMSGSSLIVAPYKNSDEKIVGVLGIIGPTRMNYARIIPMVDYTAKVVSRLLT